MPNTPHSSPSLSNTISVKSVVPFAGFRFHHGCATKNIQAQRQEFKVHVRLDLDSVRSEIFIGSSVEPNPLCSEETNSSRPSPLRQPSAPPNGAGGVLLLIL